MIATFRMSCRISVIWTCEYTWLSYADDPHRQTIADAPRPAGHHGRGRVVALAVDDQHRARASQRDIRSRVAGVLARHHRPGRDADPRGPARGHRPPLD